MHIEHPVTTDPISRFVDKARRGDAAAVGQLLQLVYDELHTIAGRHLRRERPGHTLQPTALVHEAYLRLVGGNGLSAASRVHFLRAASRAMRQALVDHARARGAPKPAVDIEPAACPILTSVQGLALPM
jgi:RNA polymerase sigma factor (TIGR02999 family)